MTRIEFNLLRKDRPDLFSEIRTYNGNWVKRGFEDWREMSRIQVIVWATAYILLNGSKPRWIIK